MASLAEQGFPKLFGPGTPTDDIAEWITQEMHARWKAEGVSS